MLIKRWSILLSRLDAVAALTTAAIAVALRYPSSKPIYIHYFNLLDDSWGVDIAYRCVRGNWLGKEVLFTFGPLYELLTGLPARLLHRTDLGFLYLTLPIIPIVLSIVLVYAIGALLLASEPVWKRLLLFLLLICFWCPFDIRPIFVAFIWAIAVRALMTLNPQTVLTKAGILSSLVTAGFLLTADTGVYSLVTVAMVAFWAFCFESQLRRVILVFGAVAAAIFAVWTLVVNLFCGSLLDFRYWRATLAQVSNYRWGQPIGLKPDMMWGVGIVVAALMLTLSGVWMLPRSVKGVITRSPLFLSSGLCLGILFMQSGLVRSGWDHIGPASFPAVVVIGLALVGTGPARLSQALPFVVIAIVLSLVTTFLLPQRPWASRWLRKNLTVHRITGECPVDTQYFQSTCLSLPQFQILSNAQAFLSRSSDSKAIVFPYENVFAVSAGKLSAGNVLQNYAANGSYMMEQQLDGLTRDQPNSAIYGLDDIASWRVDGVSSFTRSPKVWFFLQRNYQFDSILPHGYIGLHRDASRALRWTESREVAPEFTPLVLNVTAPGIYNLGNVAWIKPYDFIRLELRLKYPVQWKVLKPSAVALLIHFADGSQKVAMGVFPPNEDSEFWVYPWNEAQLAKYFLPDSGEWRATSYMPMVANLELRIAPYDSLSVLPSVVEIHKIEAVGIHLE